MVYDIFYVSKNIINENDWKQFRLRFPSAQKIDNVTSFSDIRKKAFTKLFWVIWDDLEISENFDFSYQVPEWDQNYIHVWLNNTSYDGVVLFSKNSIPTQKEFENRFYINKKEIATLASIPKKFNQIVITNYDDYLNALKTSTTDMFWGLWSNVEVTNQKIFDTYFSHHDFYDRGENHVFKNICNDQISFVNGVVLFSKSKQVSKKEIDHKFLINKKEYEIVASRNRYPKYVISNYKEYKKICNTETQPMFWCVWPDIEIVNDSIFDFYFDPNDGRYDYDRSENHVYKNSCNGVESYLSGVVLFSTNKLISEREFNRRFLVDKKEHDLVISKYRYPQYIINSYQEYTDILKNETQKMFWCIWPDVEIIDSEIFDFYFDPNDGKYDYDRSENHMFKNKVGDDEFFVSGIVLCSTSKKVSKKEIDHRFFIDKKEHDRVVSRSKPYDKFVIDTFKDYEHALETANTDMFWAIPPEVEPALDFKFDLQFPYQNNYERGINHVFKNADVEETKYNGIMLLSKKKPISAREVEYRYLIEKKEYDLVASKLKLYDIIFISYNEPNADENFDKLIEQFPRAKRVHGVKGIHQAHIAAAKLATTPMFWVVDGDAIVEDNFKFDLLLPKHDTDIVHVWLSKNPINGLTYGYGGVKLLPKYLTENMDLTRCSLDMTMSISNKFKVVPTVSNVTAFNTDPFNTWKSAFRECVKLASRPVDPKYQEETEDRLNAWCILGSDMPYGDYALSGAIAGRQFGIDNIARPTELARINDFEWLLEQFQNPSPLI